ncbi:hypothetical protein K504DRAFT_535573 [Pleomassaria siparia CBS 279.74]|uniref:EGF-like domain-containing protein n=1 Tax=Pleomassaria siparia CBS 279.74 TaxID=1314801 RepID=A0A6G1K2B1_9PLEO|nr:hypothetical protein K504DRAFT_535573 [Pleomassaria siparia CBS 279.74]
MKLSLVVTILWSSICIVDGLEAKDYCAQDNCLRAVNGTRRGPEHPVTALSHCNDYMTTTVLVNATIATTTETLYSTVTTPRPCPMNSSSSTSTTTSAPAPTLTSLITIHGTIPYYATSACTDRHYSSACSCLGVESTTITPPYSAETRTVTTINYQYPLGTCTSGIPSNATSSISSTARSNSTATATTSIYSITLSYNSTTTTTIITMTSSLSGTGTGTGIGTGTVSTSISLTSSHSNTTITRPAISSSSTVSLTSSSEAPSSTPTACPGIPNPCRATCDELANDVENCGSCGYRCALGSMCTNGVCVRPPCDSNCGELRKCGVEWNGDVECVCHTELGGSGICFDGKPLCNTFAPCSILSPCGLGFVCVASTCCGNPICVNSVGCGMEGGQTLGPVMQVTPANSLYGAINAIGEFV